jgi:hypothetical protein
MARRFNVYAGEAIIEDKGRKVRGFRPSGPIFEHHQATEDIERIGGGGYAARIFVGLNVGKEQGFTIEDLIEKVVRIRRAQGEVPNASILAQRGIYEDRQHEIVDEESAQIIIIDMSGANKRAFVDEMSDLAEKLCDEMKQESVILEIQKRGIVTDVYTVTGEGGT